MKYIKIALLAGGLASVSSFAFAQTVAPTAGVNYDAVYGSSTNTDSTASYARADKRVHTRAAHNTTNRQSRSGVTTGSGVGSPD